MFGLLSRLTLLRNFSLTTALRLATIASKAILLVYLARYLEPDELGQYGLLAATVNYAVLAFGLEYHFYNTRQILQQSDQKAQALCIRNQLLVHLVLMPAGLPFLLLVFVLGLLPWQVAGFFYAILILDHLAQEFTRFVTTLQRPMTANLMYFLRSGWIWAVVPAGVLYPQMRSLTAVWIGWIFGSSLCVALAVFVLRKLPWREVLAAPPDLKWILQGFRVCATYLLATLSSMSLLLADRYAIEIFDSTTMVGVYTFYSAIASAVQSVVYANVGMLLYPRSAQAYLRGDEAGYRSLVRKLAWRAPAMALLFSLAAALAIYPLLAVVGRPMYAEYVSVLWIVLAGAIAAAAAEAPHVALYIRHRDFSILAAEVLTAIVGLASLLFLVPRFGIYGAAVSVTIAWTSLYLIRAFLVIAANGNWSLSRHRMKAATFLRRKSP